MNVAQPAPSATAAELSASTNDVARIGEIFSTQLKAFDRERMPTIAVRRERLRKLLAILETNEEALVAAMSQDFGHRAAMESRLFDISPAIGDIKATLRHVKGWMKVRRAKTPLYLMPGKSRVLPQPLGVVGVITPWNFPINLAFPCIAAAVAAGNRVMLKPSEATPRTSELLRRLIGESFREDEIAVVTGDVTVAAAFSATPFDHILFTGSTTIGRMVAVAAAKNLTPVTLELGGKSPVFIDEGTDLTHAAGKVAFGKMMNAGQVCLSPDYVLVPTGRVEEFVKKVEDAAARLYPSLADNDDYTSIIDDRQYQRLRALIDDARARGARVIEVNPAGETFADAARKIPLHIIIDPPEDSKVMQDEIFGPILPVKSYDTLDDAIAYVNAGGKPLGLYIFPGAAGVKDHILTNTLSGGVTINDTIWHIGIHDLPFGGVGTSGIGAYHGITGFNTLSKLRPIFHLPKRTGMSALYPPYSGTTKMIGNLLRKFM